MANPNQDYTPADSGPNDKDQSGCPGHKTDRTDGGGRGGEGGEKGSCSGDAKTLKSEPASLQPNVEPNKSY